MEELYPSLKPLPKRTDNPVLKEISLKGMVRIDDHNRKSFGQLFKKKVKA